MVKEFKFNCPSCGQHILTNEEARGQRLPCPSCKKEIVIPSEISISEKETAASSAAATPSPESSVPAKTAPPEPPAQAGPASGEPSTSGAAPVTRAQVRIAVLTPDVKLNMVRAVRRRIADEASWSPGIQDGKNVYAATTRNGTATPVEVESPEATQYSLMGAFLLELHQRNVASPAPGRRRLLDQEIPNAIREVLLQEMSEEDREENRDPLSEISALSISHAQCLAALDVLEQLYSERMSQMEAEKHLRKLGKVRLSDLLGKLEQKAPVSAEDVATALYHELMDVRRRLDRLESRNADARKTSQT